MDNFFSSVLLFEYLKTKNIYAVCTIRPDRLGLLKLIDDKKMKRGDLDYQISDQGISFFKWKDNRSVRFLSNYHGNDTYKVQRRLQDGTKIDVTTPIVVKDYNGHMGGIDKADMLHAIYDRDSKSKKWWNRLFFAVLEMAYVNSYIAYVEVRREKMSHHYQRITKNQNHNQNEKGDLNLMEMNKLFVQKREEKEICLFLMMFV
ncbi:hypothetical protein AVEN_28317-1 [Araneus ventricosus]|uniref:PiggyBac transposable element-derived protein domain-containing protein n=1 Tax=Araneus ventricosus TaxID=182803 RepID=A0A4Y2DK37_ARAVE|nr:hypothetical protein AVEN_28317-1 [Araneus ventricosus]